MGSKSGGKSQVVGYRYYMSLHMGLCRGPVDEFVEIKVADLTAWNDGANVGVPVTDNGEYDINEQYLFGGDDKEGGIVGTFYLMMGAASQLVPDFIKQYLNGFVPGYRGVCSVFYYGQVCSNNPYPKPWKFRVRRALKGWDNDDCWYPERAIVQIDNTYSTTLNFILNPVPGDYIMLGDQQIPFLTVGIGDDAVGTATNFVDYVNLNSASLDSVIASQNGNTVELRVVSGQMPFVSAVGQGVTVAPIGGAIYGMNPAHIIYQCATDRAWGRGLPRSRMDDAAFRVAADQLRAEEFGMCLRWNRQDDIDSFVQSVVNHIGATVFIDRTTGLLSMRLIRDDYDPETLALFDYNSGLIEIDDDDSAASDTLYNEIVVTYHDPVTDQDGQVRIQNLASVQSLGQTISTTVQYPGLPTPQLALRVAQRDLELQSNELRRFRVKLDRSGWFIQPGEVFRISVPSRGIDRMVLRAGEVVDAGGTDGSITVTAVQDIFSLADSTYVGVQNPTWSPPDRTAHAVSERRIEEMTYRDLVVGLTQADLDTVVPDQSALKVMAKRPTNLSNDYAIDTKLLVETEFEIRGINGWEPTATLVTGIGYYDTDIRFEYSVDLTAIDPPVAGSAVLIDDEYMRLDALDITAGTATVARGGIDTIPVPHDAGARIWFENALPAGDARDYSTADVVNVKLLTRTSSSQLAEADAPTDTLVTAGRQGRPYPPGNMQVNTIPFGNEPIAVYGDIVFTWAHRDRIAEGDNIFGHLIGSTGPEPGVTYTVRVYKADHTTLLRTTTAIVTAGWTYTAAMSTADAGGSPLIFEIEAIRATLVSWQKYAISVSHNVSIFSIEGTSSVAFHKLLPHFNIAGTSTVSMIGISKAAFAIAGTSSVAFTTPSLGGFDDTVAVGMVAPGRAPDFVISNGGMTVTGGKLTVMVCMDLTADIGFAGVGPHAFAGNSNMALLHAGGPVFPAWSGASASTSNRVTIRGDASTFQREIPAGYTALGPTLTWNPSDKHASITLSNGNKTATDTAGSGGWFSVRANISQNTGKWCYEVDIDLVSDGSLIGWANSSFSLADFLGHNNNGYSWGYDASTRPSGPSTRGFGSPGQFVNEYRAVVHKNHHVSGKRYVEFKLDAVDGGGFVGVGLANSTTPLNALLGTTGSNGLSVTARFRQINYNGATATNFMPADWLTTHIVGMAIDLDNNTFWCNVDGGAYSDGLLGSTPGNPATNSRGYGIAALNNGIAVYLAVCMQDSTAFNQVTLQSSATYPVPSGFTYGW